MSAIRLPAIPRPEETVEPVGVVECEARLALARLREEFHGPVAAERRCVLADLISAAARWEMDARARRLVQICSQRAADC